MVQVMLAPDVPDGVNVSTQALLQEYCTPLGVVTSTNHRLFEVSTPLGCVQVVEMVTRPFTLGLGGLVDRESPEHAFPEQDWAANALGTRYEARSIKERTTRTVERNFPDFKVYPA